MVPVIPLPAGASAAPAREPEKPEEAPARIAAFPDVGFSEEA